VLFRSGVKKTGKVTKMGESLIKWETKKVKGKKRGMNGIQVKIEIENR
jgi:hypothetical protein